LSHVARATTFAPVKIFIGNMTAQCLVCRGIQWLPSEPTQRPSLLSEVVCLDCGHRTLCADLALQLPLDAETESAG
jgi:hypothetical protein